MSTAYLVAALVAIAANGFSGTAALVHFKPIFPGMVRAGVPESRLTFPIGTLKTPVGPVQVRPGVLLGQDGVLVAENQDLHVFGRAGTGQQGQPAGDPAEHGVEQA